MDAQDETVTVAESARQVADQVHARPHLTSAWRLLVQMDDEALLVAATAGHRSMARRAATTEPCRNCSRPIMSYDGGARWVHTNVAENSGCRAATYDPNRDVVGAWDDNLPRSWRAAPLESTCRAGRCRHRPCVERRNLH